MASGLGGSLLVFPYRDSLGHIVGQKCKTLSKDFFVTGTLKGAGLFGQHLWGPSNTRRLIITEGELDAMSVDQALQHKWAVVSVPNGAAGARKALSDQLTWLNSFEEVVLCFDNDEPGEDAVRDCVSLFKPGHVSVARLPLKDASDMLQQDQPGELVKALWNAPQYRPDGIVTISDLRAEVLRPPRKDLSWCLPTLDTYCFGRRYGDIVALGAGTGTGKTTLVLQQIGFDLTVEKVPVGIFAFEQSPAETIKRVIGMIDNKTYHIPDTGWTVEELTASMDRLQSGPPLYLYDHHGSSEWEVVRERMRYLHHAHGVRVFYLDNLTALVGGEKERTDLELIMKDIGALVHELGCWMLIVSHLSTPDGTPHEEGGHVAVRHFKGSRNIGFWSHPILGLERNQQADTDEERATTTLRFLKERYTGRATGKTITMTYDPDTGRYIEAQADVKVVPDGDSPF